MPQQIIPNSAWPWIDEPEGAQARDGLSGSRDATGREGLDPARREPDGVASEPRALRELCHDLALPATSIRLLASAAAKESDADPNLQARLQQIADEAARIAEICRYFLDPARDAGPSDLRALAADAAAGSATTSIVPG